MATLKIINGTIITGGESFVGNVVLKDGVIDYVGVENPEVPADAEDHQQYHSCMDTQAI